MARTRLALSITEWRRRLAQLESVEVAALPEKDRNRYYCRRHYARKKLAAAK